MESKFNRFYKVSQSGGSYVTATLFNPVTMEEKVITVRDYDYADGSHDNDEWYYTHIDQAAQRLWKHHHGFILEGDLVEVYKGRKLPKGFTGRVGAIKPYYDRYGRWVADYIYFEDGNRTNYNNCKLLEAV